MWVCLHKIKIISNFYKTLHINPDSQALASHSQEPDGKNVEGYVMSSSKNVANL
jgi:hypothetical protein